MHRDIKPENFLIQEPEENTPSKYSINLKLADFGLVRNYKDSRTSPLTEYVSTRWYRAPELILASKYYNEKVDVFALAANMAELYLGRPIFPGRSSTD